MFGRFSIDLISTLPLDTISQMDVLQIFQLLKLQRLSRIGKIIKNLTFKEDVKAMVKVCNLCFMLFIYLHLLACIDFYIVNIRKIWVPPSYYFCST